METLETQSSIIHSSNENTVDGVEIALEMAEPALKNFLGHLDSVSSGIKKVESRLKKHGICIPYTKSVWHGGPFLHEVLNIPFVKGRDISWIDYKENGFRLVLAEVMHRVFYGDPEVGEDPSEYTIDESTANTTFLEVVPFIEAKAHYRLDYYAHLQSFLTGFSKRISSYTSDFY